MLSIVGREDKERERKGMREGKHMIGEVNLFSYTCLIERKKRDELKESIEKPCEPWISMCQSHLLLVCQRASYEPAILFLFCGKEKYNIHHQYGKLIGSMVRITLKTVLICDFFN